MRMFLVSVCLLTFEIAVAQTSSAQPAAHSGSKRADVLSELWQFEDAVPLSSGQVDLRLTGRWVTASFPANRGDSTDDVLVEPTIYWGAGENLELSLRVPVYLGEGGDIPPDDDGNADITVGMLWRISEQSDFWPAAAISASVRTPSGDDSNGVDGELRLVLTNVYDSGIRSHVNGFVQSVNANQDQEDLRAFQWGLVAGLDGPLFSSDSVRWVADYMHRSSFRNGSSDLNMLEFGCEWQMAQADKLGMSFQVGLDDNEDTPNFGTAVTYSHSLTY